MQALATMCRQYNDYGSIVQDRAEKNLNSVNFPDFCEHVGEEGEHGSENDVAD